MTTTTDNVKTIPTTREMRDEYLRRVAQQATDRLAYGVLASIIADHGTREVSKHLNAEIADVIEVHGATFGADCYTAVQKHAGSLMPHIRRETTLTKGCGFKAAVNAISAVRVEHVHDENGNLIGNAKHTPTEAQKAEERKRDRINRLASSCRVKAAASADNERRIKAFLKTLPSA